MSKHRRPFRDGLLVIAVVIIGLGLLALAVVSMGAPTR